MVRIQITGLTEKEGIGIHNMENFIDTAPLILLSEVISELAAQIRGENGFKTPDSIQLATALYSGADIFYTNDKRLSKFPNIKILTLDSN